MTVITTVQLILQKKKDSNVMVDTVCTTAMKDTRQDESNSTTSILFQSMST